MNMKKILAFLLAAQMLLGSMAACQKDIPDETQKQEQNPMETNAPVSGETSDTPADPYADRLKVDDELPDETFGGRDFRFLVEEKYAYQLYSEDSSGVGLDAVIYDRNKRIEDRFDTKISYLDTLGKESQDLLTQYAQVGEHIAEVCAYEQYMGNTPAIYFCWANWMDIPHLNFDQPWWNKEAIENHIINDYCFNIAGDLSLTAMQMTWCIAFNMDLMLNWGYPAEDLYNMVWDGEWTLDKMIEICSPLWEDDGDGVASEGDKFGYGCTNGRTIPWTTSWGERAITVGEDRRSLVNTLGTEKIYSAVEKMCNFNHATKGARPGAVVSDFVAGNLGLYVTTFNSCYIDFANLNFSYGILPLPKYNTAQEEYLTCPDTHFTMFGVPVTLDPDDYGFCGIMMEALNAESWKTVYPAYYEEALKGRFATDENMSKMVELITNSRVYEYGVLCAQRMGGAQLSYMVCYCIRDNTTDLASQLAENDHKIKRILAEILTFFDVEDETGILGADYEIPDNQFET